MMDKHGIHGIGFAFKFACKIIKKCTELRRIDGFFPAIF